MTNKIAVLGAGAWGTALAMVARANGASVALWTRKPDHAAAINDTQRNDRYLPDVPLDADIIAGSELAVTVGGADTVLLVPPAQNLRELCQALQPLLPDGTPVVICCKGIERDSGLLPHQIVAEELPQAVAAVLSGPTFAIEVARELPTAYTLACENEMTGQTLMAQLGRPTFRPYLSDDLVGAEVGGAVKNVIAIACGIVTGAELGDNARAALIARGVAEIVRLGLALGGKRETLMGLSGIGDLTLTCTSMTSRNMSLGAALGEGRALDDVLGERHSVAEGVFTAAAVCALAEQRNVDMPICQAVDSVLKGQASVTEAVSGLLARPFKSESVH